MDYMNMTMADTMDDTDYDVLDLEMPEKDRKRALRRKASIAKAMNRRSLAKAQGYKVKPLHSYTAVKATSGQKKTEERQWYAFTSESHASAVRLMSAADHLKEHLMDASEELAG